MDAHNVTYHWEGLPGEQLYDKDGNKTGLAMDNAAWRETILSYRNHPSVMIFCIGNEMHNSGRYPEVKRLYDIGRALAPGKLIMDNSGWGEFDRESADIYSQHIAYFFPYGPHRDMFETDAPWYLNGAVSGEELDVDRGAAHTHRVCTPIRPVISHEAMHYIDIPDYEALGRKFDAFIANAGRDYLEANGIERPWYIAELEALIKRKGGISSCLPQECFSKGCAFRGFAALKCSSFRIAFATKTKTAS